MNHESDFSTDPELEARIVAWVLGEASPFEAAELERRVAADPKLAVFKRRIEAVHGLLDQAVPVQPSTLRLSAERRARLLAVIGGPPSSDEPRPSVLSLPLLHQEKKWHLPLWAYSATAACLLAGIFVIATQARFGLVRSKHAPADAVTLREPLAAEVMTERDAKTRAEMVELEEKRRDALVYRAKRAEALPTLSAADSRADFAATDAEAIALPQVKIPSVQALLDNVRQKQVGSGSASVPPVATYDYYAASTKQAITSGSYGSTTSAKNWSIVGNLNGGQVVTTGGASIDDRTTLNLTSNGTLPPPSSVDSADYASSDSTNEVVQLSPFEVRADKDQAYAAASTLAGSRVRPTRPMLNLPLSVSIGGKLEDSASRRTRGTPTLAGSVTAISAVTKEFLRDTGATNDRTLLAYAGNAKVAGLKKDVGQFEFKGNRPSAEKDEPVFHRLAPATISGPAGGRALPSDFGETLTEKQAVSTFSLHVSDVSFKLAQAALARGEKPDPASIRPEEFYNAFDYGDPAPVSGEPVACRIEQAAHPLLQQRNLVRIAMRVPAVGRDATQPLRLTVLLDTSGSMEREDRVETVRRAFEVLASLLGPNDRVTLIGFARQPRLIAKDVPGNEAKKLVGLIAHTPAEGGTNFEEALKLAAEQARGQFDAAAQNRIVALSDGAANLGADDPSQLSNQVATLRQEGVSFDACGVGIDGLDDSVLEALTRKGDGRYYVINSPEEADAGFARKLAGALHPAAQNVKVQVRFNPTRVQSYRLIGFEQHRLREEDFRNDKVAAAELAGDETAVAVYEVQPKADGEGELGDVFVRFRNAATGAMVERSWTLMYDPRTPSFIAASPSLQLAGVSALLAEKLHGGDAAGRVHLAELAPSINRLRAHYAHDQRVQEFITMFEQARRLFGE